MPTETFVLLTELELFYPPFVVSTPIAIGNASTFEDLELAVRNAANGSMIARARTPVRLEHACPAWVTATCLFAQDMLQIEDDVVAERFKADLRTFLLLAAYDHPMHAAVESIHRLQGLDACVEYMGELFRETHAKLRNAAFVHAIIARQARRDRRISGRPWPNSPPMGRPTDAAFAAEALPPQVKKV